MLRVSGSQQSQAYAGTTCRIPSGQNTRTMLAVACVFSLLAFTARSEMGEMRQWTDINGNTIDAQYQDANEAKVHLKKADGSSMVVPRSQLSKADIDYLAVKAPLPLETRICGEWMGWMTHNGGVGQVTLTIRKVGSKLEVEYFGYDHLTEDEARKADKSKPKFDGLNHWAGCYTESYILDASNSTNFLFKPKPMTQGKMLFANYEREKWQWPIYDWSASFVDPGVMYRTSVCEETNIPKYSRFIKKSLMNHPLPLDLEKGRTHKMQTLEPSVNTYSLYIPKSYDHSKPAPLLVNRSPNGNAQPLHTKMAEELGWVMIGLDQSKNGIKSLIARNNLHTAMFDCMRRLNIDWNRVYFSGFSGAARTSSIASTEFRNNVAGVICIGAGFNNPEQYPPTYLPVYFIVGTTDMNNKEVAIDRYPAEKKKGRPTELRIHPGGHTWGRAEDHEAAIRWLDELWQKNGKPRP